MMPRMSDTASSPVIAFLAKPVVQLGAALLSFIGAAAVLMKLKEQKVPEAEREQEVPIMRHQREWTIVSSALLASLGGFLAYKAVKDPTWVERMARDMNKSDITEALAFGALYGL